MDWASIGTLTTAIVAFAALNLGALQWLLARHDATRIENAGKIAEVERDLYELRAMLPREFVLREDWIRFGTTLDAKMDAMWAQMREQIADLRRALENGAR